MRLIAMGHAALAEGFALLGFETRVDATRDDVETVLAELIRTRERALVVLEHELARAETPNLERVRREGGRIVVTEIPPLHAPADYRPPVEDLVRRVLGPRVLE